MYTSLDFLLQTGYIGGKVETKIRVLNKFLDTDILTTVRGGGYGKLLVMGNWRR